MANAKESSTPGMASAAQVAKLIMVTPRRLRQLADAGYIPRAVKGKYPLAAAVQGYLAFLRSSIERAAESNVGAGLASAKEREVRLRIAKREAEVVEMADVEAFARHVSGVLREASAGIGREAAGRDPALAARIDAEIAAIFDRFDRRCAVAFARLRAGLDPIAD